MNAVVELERTSIGMPAESSNRSRNIFSSPSKITPQQRELRNGHAGRVIWFTGFSGAGKSTIASELERQLFVRGRNTYVLDGDNIRNGLGFDLSFSLDDRDENIRRVAEVAKLFVEGGFICITAFISPLRHQREYARKIFPAGKFVEVFVNTPLHICEERDPKGLYLKARSNQITDFTGISSPYESPIDPEIEIRTDQCTVHEAVVKIRDYLENQDAQMEPMI